MSKVVRYGAFFTLVALIVTLMALMYSQNQAAADVGNVHGSEIQAIGNLEGWQFGYRVVTEDNKSYSVFRDYKMSTSEFKIAVNALNKSAAKLAKSGEPFKATIIFAKPILLNDFKEFLKQAGLSPNQSFIQAIGTETGLTEASIPPSILASSTGADSKNIEPLDLEIISRIQTRSKNPLKIIGVVTTDVVLTRETYEKISTDSKIYVIDVMPQILTKEIKREHPNVQDEYINISRSLLYNFMQKEGIAPKNS